MLYAYAPNKKFYSRYNNNFEKKNNRVKDVKNIYFA